MRQRDWKPGKIMSSAFEPVTIDFKHNLPNLLPSESILAQQKSAFQVTLDEPHVKERYTVDRAWVTTARIVFATGSALPLGRLSRHESRGSDLVLTIKGSLAQWQCSICHTVNISTASCAHCGNAPSDIQDSISCPTCTYLNPSKSSICTICSTTLISSIILSKLSRSVESAIKASIERLARESPAPASEAGSNATEWGNHWKNRGAGISGIVGALDSQNQVRQKTIQEAFVDLNKLMENAQRLVSLAKDLDARIRRGKANGSSDSETRDEATVLELVKELGITSVASKDQSGDRFYVDLAKELGQFLVKHLDSRFGGTILMSELYCVFNRARPPGTLVSPDDLVTACAHLSTLSFPIRLRQFTSGTQVIQSARFQDGEMLSRLEVLCQGAENGVTPLEVSNSEKIPIILALEFLRVGAVEGRLCVAKGGCGWGERYFPNLLAGLKPSTG